MTWKPFPQDCVLAEGIHQWPMDTPNKGSVMHYLDVSHVVGLNQLLNKESHYWWS